jgi:hypothetical protein
MQHRTMKLCQHLRRHIETHRKKPQDAVTFEVIQFEFEFYDSYCILCICQTTTEYNSFLWLWRTKKSGLESKKNNLCTRVYSLLTE